jgi:mono/diheme cytochrome c family protein
VLPEEFQLRFPGWGVAAALTFGGCASLETVAPPVSATMVAAMPGTSLAALEQGRRIFTRACTSCHSAEPVDRYSLEAWRGIVSEMSDRTKLDAAGEAALLAYIAAAKL